MPNENPYLQLVTDDRAQEVRRSMSTAVDRQPDVEAKLQGLAKQFNLPVEAVRLETPEVERRAKLEAVDYEALARESPATARFLSDPQQAAVAHDDIDNLSMVEKATNALKRGWLGLQQIGPTIGARSNAASLSNIDSIESRLAAGTKPEFIPDGEDLFGVRWMTPEQRKTLRDAFIGPIGRQTTSIATLEAQKRAIPQDAVIAAAMQAKNFSTFWENFKQKPFEFIGTVGLESLPQSLPGMVAAIPAGIAAGPAGVAAAMGGGSFGVDYASTIISALQDAGVDVTNQAAVAAAVQDQALMKRVGRQAFSHAAVVGAFDAASGGLAGKSLAPAKLAGKPLAREAANLAAQAPVQGTLGALGEAGGEVAAGQDLNAGNIASEFFGEFVSSPVDVGVAVAGHAREKIAVAQAAQQDAQALTALNELAATSKLRERDPASFQKFVAQAMEDGPVQDIYINANTLAQSGVDVQALAQVSPSVAAQFQEAMEIGGDIRIPVDEFATTIAGTELYQSLASHLKTDPAGMTQAEAEEYLQNQSSELQAEVEKVLAEKSQDDTFKASRDAVAAQVQEQLNTTNRFTPDVNAKYATLMSNFYAVMGAKIGATPEEMAARYPLQVRANRPVTDEGLDQKGVDETTGLPLNPDGTVTVYHHTNKKAAAEIATTGKLKADAEPDVYVTTREETDTGYGDTVVAINVDPSQLQLDDEFPDGRKDFRLSVGKPGGSIKIKLPGALNQPDQVGARGSIILGDQETQSPAIITLLERADLSTFLHESGHFFLEVLNDMASKPDAPQNVADDMDAVLKWFGVADLATWNAMTLEEKREHHEQFARGFEAYLFEGNAPSVEMQSLFQQFRAWMLNVYQSLMTLDVTLTDEVRAVFDRMLASSQSIAEAEAVRGFAGLFKTKPDFMTDQEFTEYQSLGTGATQDAIHTLETRSLKDMRWLTNAKSKLLSKMQREAAEKRKAVRREVSDEVMAEPVNKARQFFKRGEVVNESGDTVKVDGVHKLDIKALSEMYGGNGDKYALLDWSKLGHGAYGMLGNEGIHPDIAADMFGYQSGDQLVRDLLNAENAREKIEGITDQRMLEKYGDMTDQRSIERAVDASIHNDVRMRFVASEVNAMNKAVGKRPILARAARTFAETTVARTKVRDLKPSQYTSAEARAAKNADAAFKKGDLPTAAAEKRNQLINGYAAKGAHDAQTEITKTLEYFTKFDREGTRKNLDSDYLDQIDALLDRFDLRKGQTLKAIDKRKSLADWIASQVKMGVEPDIPPELMNEALRKSYKDMTVEEVRGLRDAVKQIEHLARLKNKLLTAKDEREFAAVVDSITNSINENAGDRAADTRTATTYTGRVVQGLRRFWASHVKAANWSRIMDGGKDGGQMWEYFIRSANEKGDHEATMFAEATKELTNVLEPVFKLGRMGGSGQYFATIDRSLNRESRLAIALNAGNASNLQRLLGGEGWTTEQIKPVLDSLTLTEWKAVQQIWDYFESYRPLIAAKEKRVYGKEPDWIDAQPLTVTRDGETLELRGGYYPIKYDPAASQRAEEHADAEDAKRQLQGAYTSATTRRSFTKARVDEVVGRPLLYSLAGLYSGVHDIIHDLSWHEWLIDTNRLLRSDKIDSAIRGRYGPEVKAQFKSWVEDIAEGGRASQNAGEVALGKLRQHVSAAGLGFNAVSAAMQGLGLTQSIVRVGPAWVGRGIAEYLGSPLSSAKSVQEKSEFMRNRARTRFRELNELRGRVQGERTDVIKTHAYVLMMRAQQMVDVPTWLGAYAKALAAGNAEERSVSLADQAVIDSQGGGQTKDLSSIERGGQAQRLFTVFYSFMNTAFNLGVTQTMTAKSKAKLTADYLLLYTVPAVLGFALKNALTPGDSGDDDDTGQLAAKLGAAQLNYLLGLMFVVREFGEAAKLVFPTGERAHDYAGPAGVRLVTDTGAFVKQAAQGEFDDSFRKAAVNLAGDALGLPSAQINRTITGVKAINEGKTSNPAAVAFGFQERK